MLDRLLNWFAGAAPAAAGNVAPVREALGVTIDADEDQWRALTGNANRDLSPLDQSRMQKIASWLWERNPLANRPIELVVAYLLGEGVRLTCKDKEAQKLLDRFWRDPINAMDMRLESMVREGELYGEQCYPVFVNDQDGHVRLGYLDPQLIETVVMDPDNPSQPIGVVTVKDKQGKARRYKVILGAGEAESDERLFTKRTVAIRDTFGDGACFFLRRNHLLGGKRGRSSLLAQMDWVDGYDEFLWGELDRARDLRTVLWDVKVTGATEEDLKAKAAAAGVPSGRTIRFHNENEEWTARTAELQAGEGDTISRLFRNHVLGGFTVPEHWFGGGGDVNRNAASEMGEPTFKVFTQKQRAWKAFLELIGRYVLAQAADKGRLKGYDPEDEDYQVVAEFPELTARDTTKYAAAVQQVAAAMVVLIGQGLLSEETALRVVGMFAQQLGVQIDAKAELEAARKEREDREARERDLYGAPNLDAGDDGTGGEGGADNRPRVPGMARAPAQGAEDAREAFDPQQPRVPAGNPEGGQWTDEGTGVAAGGSALAEDGPPTGGMKLNVWEHPSTGQTRLYVDNALPAWEGKVYIVDGGSTGNYDPGFPEIVVQPAAGVYMSRASKDAIVDRVAAGFGNPAKFSGYFAQASMRAARGAEAGAKVYLNVPYAMKDIAKGAGARWDRDRRSWYYQGAAIPAALGQFKEAAAPDVHPDGPEDEPN
jgi:hypothetical protein